MFIVLTVDVFFLFYTSIHVLTLVFSSSVWMKQYPARRQAGQSTLSHNPMCVPGAYYIYKYIHAYIESPGAYNVISRGIFCNFFILFSDEIKIVAQPWGNYQTSLHLFPLFFSFPLFSAFLLLLTFLHKTLNLKHPRSSTAYAC